MQIKKVLVANRGEIAIRLLRALVELKMRTVAIYTYEDRYSQHRFKSDEAYQIGGNNDPLKPYLDIDEIINLAKEKNVDAIHPGYGFLSENAEFARRVIDAGMVFIGPRPESIEALGSKTAARAKVTEFGVPCTPGTLGDLDDQKLIAAAREIGFPMIIKAIAGGGGRGMRVVETAEQMAEVLPRARAEALKNFSNAAVYAERYISRPRHVEVQIFGDEQGNVLHFGTRDCSTQRRHQKLVEEAPAPFLSNKLRSDIHAAALQAARSVGYINAGTAEFLVDGDQFYFLEMNTRIQVEHPATEIVTGVDLVQLQLKVAQGEPIGMRQEDITFDRHAIEFRIVAEDPAANFAPTRGTISRLSCPKAEWVREDAGYASGDQVSLFYDAMLSKLLVSGATREEAIERGYQALCEYRLEGFTSNLDFHRWLLRLSPFRRSPLDIGYLEREFGAPSLDQLRESEVRDPRHRTPVGEAIEIDRLSYFSNAFNSSYQIEVSHESDGTFIARPLLTSGTEIRNRFCRRSNGFEAVVRALITEVLERVAPKDLVSSALPTN